MSQVRIIKNPLIYWAICVPSCFSPRYSPIQRRNLRSRRARLRLQTLASSSLPTFSEPSPIEFLSRSTFAPPRSVPRLTRFRTRPREALGKTTCTRKSTILPNDNAIIHYFGFALQPRQRSPVWGNSRPNRQKPLILLGHFDFSPAKRPLKKKFFSPVFTPAARGLTHPRAPFRALSRIEYLEAFSAHFGTLFMNILPIRDIHHKRGILQVSVPHHREDVAGSRAQGGRSSTGYFLP